MATFGEALEALDEFRTMMVDRQQNLAVPAAQAMAFRASMAMATDSVLGRVHATGVGVPEGVAQPKPDDFVIKVYVFDPADVGAAQSEALLTQAQQGVQVEVTHLPVQVAFQRAERAVAARPVGARRAGGKAGKANAAAAPAQHQRRVRPVPGGVEIGPLGGNYVGTLGCFVRRGADGGGPLFVLSNNHVLSDVNRLPLGGRFTQPFSAAPADVIATLSDFEPLRFPAPGSQPRNVIDAAIAAVADPAQVVTGRILNVPRYVPTLLAARPGMRVTKSGRTTGVTTGTVRAVRVRGVQVNYGSAQNPVIATFDNAITVTGDAGLPFSRPGDSGSVILDMATGRPVALLFAGDLVTTTACDLAAACSRFGVRPV